MISWVLKQYVSWHARRVHRSMWNPREAQTATFERLRRQLAGSEVSISSGLERCRSLEDCRALPASDSSSLKPLFDRVFALGDGARRVFGRSRVVGFARTSGTLAEPKTVPLNRAYMASLDRTLVRVFATHLHTAGERDGGFSDRRILLGSRPHCGTSPTGLPVCDISGLASTRTWWSTRWLFIPRYRDLWIEDWSTKAERILDQARDRRIVSIAGIPALAMDLAKRACAKYGVTHLDQVWPHLREYVYGAVPLSPDQKDHLRQEWFSGDSKVDFFETYFATEGALAFSLEPNHQGLALNSLENLYLFRSYSGDRSFLFADELQEKAQYSIHVTTPGGLVNYHLGDRIEVTSTKPLLIRFVRREADELSMTGEKITLPQLDLALGAVGLGPARLGLLLPAVWVELGESPRLVWALPALARESGTESAWASRLDQALGRVNVLYREALELERVIAPSRVVFLPEEIFERYAGSRLGAAQFKPKRMFNSAVEFSAAYGWTESPPAPAWDG